MFGAVAVAIAVVALPASAGAAPHTVTRTFSSGNLDEPITPSHLARAPIRVPAKGRLKDVDVKLRVDHPNLADLKSIEIDNPLRHSTGRAADLASGGFLTGANLGSGPGGCGDQLTTFDDQAPTPISAGTAPYPGSYAPDQPLDDSFKGFRITGKWGLVITEVPGADIGTLQCWKIRLTYVPR